VILDLIERAAYKRLMKSTWVLVALVVLTSCFSAACGNQKVLSKHVSEIPKGTLVLLKSDLVLPKDKTAIPFPREGYVRGSAYCEVDLRGFEQEQVIEHGRTFVVDVAVSPANNQMYRHHKLNSTILVSGNELSASFIFINEVVTGNEVDGPINYIKCVGPKAPEEITISDMIGAFSHSGIDLDLVVAGSVVTPQDHEQRTEQPGRRF